MTVLKSILHLIDTLNEWTGKVSAFIIIAMIFIIGYGVVMRYVFNSPVLWAYELSLYLFIAQLLLCAGYGLSHGLHVRMDILYDRFSKRKRAILDSITSVFFFFIVILLLWQGAKYAINAYLTQELAPTAWRPVIWPVKAIYPLGCFLLMLQGVAKLIRDLHYAIKGEELR